MVNEDGPRRGLVAVSLCSLVCLCWVIDPCRKMAASATTHDLRHFARFCRKIVCVGRNYRYFYLNFKCKCTFGDMAHVCRLSLLLSNDIGTSCAYRLGTAFARTNPSVLTMSLARDRHNTLAFKIPYDLNWKAKGFVSYKVPRIFCMLQLF